MTGRPLPVLAFLKDAGLAALVALIIGFPLIGLEHVDLGQDQPFIATRFDWLALAVAAVFVGRFMLRTLVYYWPKRTERAEGTAWRFVSGKPHHRLLFGVIGIGLAVALPFFPFSSRYLVDLGTNVLIYVMLGWGLNVVVGLAGLLDLGYVAFYAVGAYSFALLAQWFHISFWEGLPIAGALAATAGVLLGFPVLRLRGDYLAIVTLGFGEIVRITLNNWLPVTGGPNGVSNIPRPSFFGMPFTASAPDGVTSFSDFFGIDYDPMHRVIFLYFVILAMALATNFVTLRLRRLPIGRAWEALREDEIACRALGINPTTVKLTAFATGAMLGGFAGAFFGARLGFISPESFTFIESAIILAIVVLGGMGSQLGVVLAAILLVTIPEFGREFAQFRMLVFGAAMVAIMVWRPRGLLAHRRPSILLRDRGRQPALARG